MHRVQYGARLKVDEGDKIKRGQRIAEWDPFTRPILTEVDGDVGFEDLIEGQSMSEHRRRGRRASPSVSSSTGARTALGRPQARDRHQGKDGKIAKLPRGGDARYMLPVDSIIVVRAGLAGEGGRHSSRVFRSTAPRPATSRAVCRAWRSCSRRVGRRITRSSRRSSGTVQFGRDYKNKQRLDHSERGGRGACRVSDPEGQAHPSAGWRRRREGRLYRRWQSRAARHPRDQGRGGTGGLSRQRDPGGLPVAGREHQRQAHRGDRPSDAAEGRHCPIPATRASWRASRSITSTRAVERKDGVAEGGKPAVGTPVLLGITKASPADALLHFGGVLPGNHARPHGSGGQRQGRYARGPEGERHRRPPDSGGHGRGDVEAAANRTGSRRPDSRAAGGDVADACAATAARPRSRK